MKQSNCTSIKVLLVLLTQLLVIQAGCLWDTMSQTQCAISCTSSYSFNGIETPQQVLAILEQRWNEREDCHTEGIYLTLTGISFAHFNVQANWFTAQVKVKELTFGTSSVATIEANAFNSTALKHVTRLVFPNMNLNQINKGIFNGLESVEVLAMNAASLRVIESGVLNALSETLKRFTVIQATRFSSEIWINGFTGAKRMTALEEVKFLYNLRSTIDRRTFLGLEYVKTLDLSECQIDAMGAGAFDPISNSIRELNLRDNLIQTLPGDLFQHMLPSPVTTIIIEGNTWNCDCDLMPFKTVLLEHSNFVGSVLCRTPTHLRGYDVIETDFCDDYSPVPPTASTSDPPTSNIPDPTTQSTSGPPTPPTRSTTDPTTSSTSDPTTSSTSDPTTSSTADSTTSITSEPPTSNTPDPTTQSTSGPPTPPTRSTTDPTTSSTSDPTTSSTSDPTTSSTADPTTSITSEPPTSNTPDPTTQSTSNQPTPPTRSTPDPNSPVPTTPTTLDPSTSTTSEPPNSNTPDPTTQSTSRKVLLVN